MLLVVVARLNFLSNTEAHLGTYSSFEKNSLKNVYFCLYDHQYSDLSKLHLLESLQFSLILHDNDTPIKLGFTIEKHNQSSLIH